jgi:hypothetical protein
MAIAIAAWLLWRVGVVAVCGGTETRRRTVSCQTYCTQTRIGERERDEVPSKRSEPK